MRRNGLLGLVCLEIVLGAASHAHANGGLVRIEIEPNNFGVFPGPTLTFVATGYDAGDGVVPLVDPTWDGTGGPLTPSGNRCELVATDTGNHSITCSKDGITGTAVFRILGPLHHITVTPPTNHLSIGESVELTAAGYDEHDSQVPLQDLVWSATSGTITPTNGARAARAPAPNGPLVTLLGYNAVYTATAVGTHTVTASDQGIDGTATMIVGAGRDRWRA